MVSPRQCLLGAPSPSGEGVQREADSSPRDRIQPRVFSALVGRDLGLFIPFIPAGPLRIAPIYPLDNVVLCGAIARLNGAVKLFLIAIDLDKILIRQLDPLRLQGSFEL